MTEEARLWDAYRRSKDAALRERLILHYAPLVKKVIGRVAVSLPPDLEYEDLLSYGIMGLIDALDRFDQERGTSFEGYAQLRIKGHVIDALRSMGLVPRSARDRAKEIEKGLSELRQSLGRTPTDEELSGHLGLSLERFRQALSEASFAIVSLDSPLNFDDEGKPLCLGDMLQDASAVAPSVQAEDGELVTVLREAIRELPERERLVIALYYYEELNMKEIGQVLGVSESRVSQVHAKAIFAIRARLRSYLESGRRAEGKPKVKETEDVVLHIGSH